MYRTRGGHCELILISNFDTIGHAARDARRNYVKDTTATFDCDFLHCSNDTGEWSYRCGLKNGRLVVASQRLRNWSHGLHHWYRAEYECVFYVMHLLSMKFKFSLLLQLLLPSSHLSLTSRLTMENKRRCKPSLSATSRAPIEGVASHQLLS